MATKICVIDAYDGLCKAERLMRQNNTTCLPVMKDGKLAGLLTLKDLMQSHPNRIAADAMTKNVISVKPAVSLWKAKQLFEENQIHELLVMDDNKPAGIVTRARLYEELGKHTDLLTGLYRSNYIYHMGMELIEQHVEFSVVFIDLDNFGQIDKSYGHVKGDEILKEISVLLSKHTHSGIYLCRFGGDEFVLLMPYQPDKCKPFAELLLKAITVHHFTDNITVTASAGIAGWRQQTAKRGDIKETFSNLINHASLASTQAKKDKKRLLVAETLFLQEAACTR